MDTIIFQVDNELKDSDMDGLEPPLLDEKWGLSAALNGKLILINNIYFRLRFCLLNTMNSYLRLKKRVV